MHLNRLILVAAAFAATAPAQTRPAIQAAPTAPVSAAPAAAAPAGGMAARAVDNRPSGVSSDTYVIGSGDVLQLVVWREPNFSNSSIPVRPDGRISLSLLGDIPAAGMTPMLLGQDISNRLKKYVNDPLVTVTVISFAAKEIYLIGEVAKTGPVVLSPGMNLLQAIAAGGGLSPFAKKKLYILRKGPKGEQKIPFDYKKALKTGDQQGITLQPGDTIVVP